MLDFMAAGSWKSSARGLEKGAVCLLFYYRGLPVRAYPHERTGMMPESS
jgi:hypothetical protein